MFPPFSRGWSKGWFQSKPKLRQTHNVNIISSYNTVGQRNYFTTRVTVLYELPLVAVLAITGNNNVINHFNA